MVFGSKKGGCLRIRHLLWIVVIRFEEGVAKLVIVAASWLIVGELNTKRFWFTFLLVLFRSNIRLERYSKSSFVF